MYSCLSSRGKAYCWVRIPLFHWGWCLLKQKLTNGQQIALQHTPPRKQENKKTLQTGKDIVEWDTYSSWATEITVLMRTTWNSTVSCAAPLLLAVTCSHMQYFLASMATSVCFSSEYSAFFLWGTYCIISYILYMLSCNPTQAVVWNVAWHSSVTAGNHSYTTEHNTPHWRRLSPRLYKPLCPF